MTVLTIAQQLAAIERDVREAGKKVSTFRRDLGIHSVTWYRWKKGLRTPRADVWQRVQQAAEKLDPAA